MSGSMWFALAVGHVAWSVHLMLSYQLAWRACGGDSAELLALRHFTTLVMGVLTLGGLAIAARERRWAAVPPSAGAAERRFLAGLALPLGAMFLFGIAGAGAMNVFLTPCA
jgi:hypothetical protein